MQELRSNYRASISKSSHYQVPVLVYSLNQVPLLDLKLMITEKVLLCGNTLMKCCCGATLYFLRQGARSKASNFILCLELF